MDTISLKIETYACEYCGYYQNADPFQPGWMARNFPEFPGIPDGACPACYSGRNPERVQRDCTLSRLVGVDIPTTTTTASDEHLESELVEELDDTGNVIMEQVGERYELRVNQQNGQIYSEPVPVMAPKLRPRSSQEVSGLKEQRDRNLDELERVAA